MAIVIFEERFLGCEPVRHEYTCQSVKLVRPEPLRRVGAAGFVQLSHGASYLSITGLDGLGIKENSLHGRPTHVEVDGVVYEVVSIQTLVRGQLHVVVK